MAALWWVMDPKTVVLLLLLFVGSSVHTSEDDPLVPANLALNRSYSAIL